MDTINQDDILNDVLSGLPNGVGYHISNLQTTVVDNMGNSKVVHLKDLDGIVSKKDDKWKDIKEYKLNQTNKFCWKSTHTNYYWFFY